MGQGGAKLQDGLLEDFGRSATQKFKNKSEVASIEICANVENITEINTIKQTFTAKLYIEARLMGLAKDDEHNAEMDNVYFQRFGFRNIVEWEDMFRETEACGTDLVLRWRLVGTFEEEMELWDFPLDTQKLQIQFTVSNSNEGKHPVKLEPDLRNSKVRQTNFVLRNVWVLLRDLYFNLEDSDASESARNHTYPILRVVAVVQRRAPYYVWNVYIPMLTFVIMSFMSYFVHKKDVADRMDLSLTLVLTAAAYKFVVAGMLPAVGYLTLLDKYVLACMMFLFLIVVEHGVCSRPPFKMYHMEAMWALAGLYIFINVVFVIRVIYLQFRRRWHRMDATMIKSLRHED